MIKNDLINLLAKYVKTLDQQQVIYFKDLSIIADDVLAFKEKTEHIGFDSKQFIKQFNYHTGKAHRILENKAKRQLKQRLKEGYSKQDVLKAIKNCAADSYHKETKLKYLTPEFITRSDKLDKYLNATPTTKRTIQSKYETTNTW